MEVKERVTVQKNKSGKVQIFAFRFSIQALNRCYPVFLFPPWFFPFFSFFFSTPLVIFKGVNFLFFTFFFLFFLRPTPQVFFKLVVYSGNISRGNILWSISLRPKVQILLRIFLAQNLRGIFLGPNFTKNLSRESFLAQI